MESEGTHRYFCDFDKNAPIQEQVVPEYPSTWDNYKNNNIEKRSRVAILLFFQKETSVDHQIVHHQRNFNHNSEENDEEIGENKGVLG